MVLGGFGHPLLGINNKICSTEIPKCGDTSGSETVLLRLTVRQVHGWPLSPS